MIMLATGYSAACAGNAALCCQHNQARMKADARLAEGLAREQSRSRVVLHCNNVKPYERLPRAGARLAGLVLGDRAGLERGLPRALPGLGRLVQARLDVRRSRCRHLLRLRQTDAAQSVTRARPGTAARFWDGERRRSGRLLGKSAHRCKTSARTSTTGSPHTHKPRTRQPKNLTAPGHRRHKDSQRHIRQSCTE